MKKLLLPLIVLTTLCLAQGKAMAEVAPQPCDPQFYAQMNARAWLESEREIMQNQNLIFKADSVLEYTCFDRFANVAAWEIGEIFTHTKYFGGSRLVERGAPYGLEELLQKIIIASMEEYQKAPGVAIGNFEHNWLGGRGDHLGMTKRPFDPTTTKLPYACTVMADVWKVAKCLNFVHNDDFNKTDAFYPFEELKCPPGATGCSNIKGYDSKPDVRLYPKGLECVTEAGIFNWNVASAYAENRGQSLYKFQTPLGLIFEDVLDKTAPGNCKKANTIPTGVTVVLKGGPSHADGVCTNPGCTYTAPEGGGPAGYGLGECK